MHCKPVDVPREEWRMAWSAYRAKDGSFRRLENMGSKWATIVYLVLWQHGDILRQRELIMINVERTWKQDLVWRRADVVRRTAKRLQMRAIK